MLVLAAMRNEERAGSVKRYRAPCTASATIAGARRSVHPCPEQEAVSEVVSSPIRCGRQIGVKARRQHVACADLVMGRHHQMRQRKLLRKGPRGERFSPYNQQRCAHSVHASQLWRRNGLAFPWPSFPQPLS